MLNGVVLDDHQKVGIVNCVNSNVNVIAYATGTGKTLISYGTHCVLDKKGLIDKSVFVVTKSSKIEYASQFKSFSDGKEEIEDVSSFKEFKKFMSKDSSAKIALIQYEALKEIFLTKEQVFHSIKEIPYSEIPVEQRKDIFTIADHSDLNIFKKSKSLDFAESDGNYYAKVYKTRNKLSKEVEELITQASKMFKIAGFFDEAHRIGGITTAQRKACDHFRKMLHRVYGLTATPYDDMEALYDFISFFKPDFYQGSKFQFLDDFCVREKRKRNRHDKIGYWVTIRNRNIDVLRNLLDPIVTKFYPEYKVEFVEHSIEIENKRDYKLAAAGLLEEDSIPEITESSFLEALSELSGKNFNSRFHDLQRIVDKDENKIDLFKKVASGLKEKGVVVYSNYLDNIDILKDACSELEMETYCISGSTSSKDREKFKDSFMENPKNKVMIITDAGGQSLNLQATNEIIFYSMAMNPKKFYQTIGRICRLYSKYDEFKVHVLLADANECGGIDRYKYTFLKSNSELIKELLQNFVLPTDDLTEKFNYYLLQSFRQSMLWDI